MEAKINNPAANKIILCTQSSGVFESITVLCIWHLASKHIFTLKIIVTS
jgi:hypothetical protein